MMTLIGILAFLLVAAIFAAGFYQNRQEILRRRDRERGLLERRHAELEQLFQTLLATDTNNDVALCLNRELIRQTRAIAALSRKPGDLQGHFEALQQRQTQLSDGSLAAGGQLSADSDHELEAMHRCFAEANQQLRRILGRGDLSATEFEQLSRHLHILTLESEVDSHLRLGRQWHSDGATKKALAHLRTARKTLEKTALEIADRQARIHAINLLIREAEAGAANAAQDGADQA